MIEDLKKEKIMVTLKIKLDEQLKKDFELICQYNKRSAGEVLVFAIKEYLKKNKLISNYLGVKEI